MINKSFTVGFMKKGSRRTTIVSGVTSIVPNLNGVLMFTRSGENFFVESCDLVDGILPNMFIEYSTSEDIAQYDAQSDRYEFFDMGIESDWL